MGNGSSSSVSLDKKSKQELDQILTQTLTAYQSTSSPELRRSLRLLIQRIRSQKQKRRKNNQTPRVQQQTIRKPIVHLTSRIQKTPPLQKIDASSSDKNKVTKSLQLPALRNGEMVSTVPPVDK